ncbi:MAG: septum formation protein Maf [Phycisphaerae bacterium]|nr:septum formation protein Maf [Phycisphaerae bacterium]
MRSIEWIATVGCPNYDAMETSNINEGSTLMQWKKPLVLASASPRRVELLISAGIDAFTCPPTIDDGVIVCGSLMPNCWVETLAVMKAQHVAGKHHDKIGTILAADTVCVVDNQILGQPKDAEDARQMLLRMNNRSHEVFTGWCLISMDGEQLESGCEVASITIGEIDAKEITQYVDSQKWCGKAGAYNLSERVAAGWPIICDGDPTCVMGLPMDRLKENLHCFFGDNS